MSLETMLKWRLARAVKVDRDTIAHNKSMVYYITTISRMLNRVNMPQVKNAFSQWRKSSGGFVEAGLSRLSIIS